MALSSTDVSAGARVVSWAEEGAGGLGRIYWSALQVVVISIYAAFLTVANGMGAEGLGNERKKGSCVYRGLDRAPYCKVL